MLKQSASATDVARPSTWLRTVSLSNREARDMRERRDADRLDSPLVLPISRVTPVAPFPLVAHVSRANIVFPQPAKSGDDLARIIHEGSSRKRADAKRDGHSET